MTSTCSSTFQGQCAGGSISTQIQPNWAQNTSHMQPQPKQQGQRRNNTGSNSQQQNKAQSQCEKEEELAEWLNDVYKRKR